ncbi:MAG: Gfo/Idh/MocA family oxidoreductase [Xanthomonadales bacterium]|nr:Gfo/Idh/MocA family oxidoreductase [Xanthomonadales bacterium]
MKKDFDTVTESSNIDSQRRDLLKAAGVGVLAATFSNVAIAGSHKTAEKDFKTIRWGIVGTGGIANSMAPMILKASNAELVAVSSRKMESAKKFAGKHKVSKAFDSWADMFSWDGVDAIYVATPTSVREEICVAAANKGKHVLGEKPFANLASLQRITTACKQNGVGFMDGTHFVHSPRTKQIKSSTAEMIGWPWSIASAFQFGLTDKSNIRMNPKLEPYGAIGDAGWYNMRAAVEYTTPGIEIKSVDAYLRRDSETNAVVSASGIIVFDDGSTTTWNCGFESGAGIMDLRISGAKGVIKLDDFLSNRPSDQPADFEYRQGWGDTQFIEVPFDKPEAALMFEDFSAMVGDADLLAASIQASERTQQWLDAIWNSALSNESNANS